MDAIWMYLMGTKKTTKSEESCDESMEIDSQEVKSYPKNSFDRFGDDLSEVIVSHLSLEDKFRFQCLSKQWSRLVFKRQYDLTVEKMGNNFRKQLKTLKKIVKKCPNIESIALPYYVEDEYIQKCKTLRVITRYLTKVSTFKCWSLNVSKKRLDQFFAKFGHTLKRIEIEILEDNTDWISYLDNCPDLEVLSIAEFNDGIDWNKHLFPRLKKFQLTVGMNINNFTIFLKNHKNLEVIDINLNGGQYEELTELFGVLSQLKQLKSLRIEFVFDLNNKTVLTESMKTIANQCKQLNQLVIRSQIPDSSEGFVPFVLGILKRFPHLRRFEVKADLKPIRQQILGSLSFRCCPQLTKLTIDLGSMEITDRFFDYISEGLSRVKYLNLHNFSGSADLMAKQLSKPSQLRSLQLSRCQNFKIKSLRNITEVMAKRPKLDITFE